MRLGSFSAGTDIDIDSCFAGHHLRLLARILVDLNVDVFGFVFHCMFHHRFLRRCSHSLVNIGGLGCKFGFGHNLVFLLVCMRSRNLEAVFGLER